MSSRSVASLVASRTTVRAALLVVAVAVAALVYTSASSSTNVPNGSAYLADSSSATPTPPYIPPVFEDVPEGSAHAEGIATVARLRITVGTSATTFSPSESVTRAQMATFMARTWSAAGRDCPTSGFGFFDDVAAGSSHATGIDCMSALNVIKGTAPRTFSPSESVTRAQMATFMARAWRAAGRDCPTSGAASFTDVPASSTHAESIRCISALGITQGTTAETFSPSESVTRAQMATFLTRFHQALTA